MAKRMIHTNIWASGQVGKLSKEARLVFIGLITLADDDGRLKGNPAFLRSQIFPYDEELKTTEVKKWLEEIVAQELVLCYEITGEDYLYHPNWKKYQTLRSDRKKESHIPEPDGFVRAEDEIVLPNNPSLPRKLSLAVYNRDGSRCRYCGETQRPFHVDHVIPKSKGGETNLSNLVIACARCNLVKNDSTLAEMGWELLPIPSRADKVRTFVGQTAAQGKVRKGKVREVKVGEAPKGELTPKEKTILFFEAVDKQNDAFHLFVQQLAQQNTVPPESIRRELKKFADYWTEKNGTGTKMRWQTEKVFEIRRRLATWFGRVGFKNFSAAQAGNKGKNIIL